MKRQSSEQAGSTLVVTIVVIATLLVLLGVAVDYSTQISRVTQRSRKTALAMEIADGHLETLFTNWRNIYRTSWVTYGLNTAGTDYSVCGTNFFATTLNTPSPLATPLPFMNPAVTPPVIPTPDPLNFGVKPTDPEQYRVTQYRIQAVDPMVDLDANENALVEGGSKGGGNFVSMAANSPPPGAYGPNPVYLYGSSTPTYFPYSYYYLAAADVKVPTTTGDVTAKVRRVFEKKFDVPWTYLIFYVDDLEFDPGSTFTVNGPIHTNGSLYITNNKFTVASPTYGAPTPFPTSGRIEYGGDYVNGYHPKDSRYPGSGFTAPTFAKSDPTLTLSDCPPAQVAPYLPFGWNLALNSANTGSGSGNDDGYHEIIEPPVKYPTPPAGSVDPLGNVRYYNQAGIKVLIDYNNNISVYRAATTSVADSVDPSKNVKCTSSSTGNDYKIWKLIAGPNGAVGKNDVASNLALADAREVDGGGIMRNIRITEVDINKITAAANNPTSNNVGGYSNIDGITGFNGVIYIADTTPPFDMNGNRVVVPSTGIVQVPDPSSPAAAPSPSPFDATAVAKAKIVSNGGSTTNLVTTTERAIRLVNGWALPAKSKGAAVDGLTVVSLNPIYIKGNYNTSDNVSSSNPTPAGTPPSNVTTTSAPTTTGYTQRPSAVIGDAINVLSGNWDDSKSPFSISGGGYNVSNPRAAINTTINTALIGGIVPTSSAGYSGGGEGFIRLQEDWRTQNFVYYGSISQFFTSAQGTTPGSPSGQYFKPPAATRWFYDYQTFADAAPPGNLQIAAYLQQQRWYQVY